MAARPRHSAAVRFLLICALAVLAAAGCAGSTEGSSSTSVATSDSTIAPTTLTLSPPPNPWPSQLESTYMAACRRGTEASARGSISPLSVELYCTCTLERLQRKFTAEGFADAEAKFIRGEASGLDMRAIASGCDLGGT
ncbi:MAG: hypothetical protein F2520_08960 [Actinobacteria bacterium]|uniref:Unannotated protein n=1 Tax=freshwater metagenome TaxID=449393 RepID=A0A6J5YF09_9ZZZZ|nr:hypothetical protein [Actinomycetota bacterium]